MFVAARLVGGKVVRTMHTRVFIRRPTARDSASEHVFIRSVSSAMLSGC